MFFVEFGPMRNDPLISDLPGYIDDHLLFFGQEIVHVTLLFTT